MGFGPIAPEKDEPIFHADWEKRALGLTLAAGAMGHWSIDESRHARESLHPADYYASSYYEIWIKGLERLLQAHDFVSARELVEGRALAPGAKPKRVLAADKVAAVLAAGGPTERPATAPAAFAIGDRVRTRVMNPVRHTRLPRYARGKTGRIEALHGAHVFPDTSAHREGEQPQWLYTVVFDGRELWGVDAEAANTISIDAGESYLERA
jgi:nitrile hydratase